MSNVLDVGEKTDGWRVDYDRVQHEVYQRGRTLAPEVIRQWVDAVAEHAPPRTERVADVGAGTGRFTPALAERLGASVVGVEPSIEMVKRAMQDRSLAGVSYVVGRAEKIPIADAAVDLVFLSMVAHHLDDMSSAAGEVARVSMEESVIVFRNVFQGRMDDVPLFRYFPRALEIENARAPDVEDLAAMFAPHGFQVTVLDSVLQATDPSLTAYRQRLSQRALSVFEFLTEQEIAEGLSMLEQEANATSTQGPVLEPIDLLVLRR